MFKTFAPVLAAAALFLPANSAFACAGSPCPEVRLEPAAQAMPANAVGFRLPGSPQFKLEHVPEAGSAEALETDSVGEWVVPHAQLEVGQHYRLTASPDCDAFAATPIVQEFQVGPAVALANGLGTTVVFAQGSGTVPIAHSASCWEEYTVPFVDVRPDFAGVDAALVPVFAKYRVIVDGKPFDWQKSENGSLYDEFGEEAFGDQAWYRDPGTFRLWTWCGAPGDASDDYASYGLSAGEHDVHIEAEIPGTVGKVLSSASLQVELSCPKADVDAGQPMHSIDPGAADAGTHLDAGAASGHRDDAADDTGPARHARSGCAVYASSVGSGRTGAWLSLAFALWALQRRRRSRH